VRETSRKPDEIYNLIERMSPGGKKLELFGRPHNCRVGWLTLGNQLPGNYIKDPDILKRFVR
jgi:mRNA (2'-O-methyladenosine-N6-)-methyltransferase